MRRRNTKGWHSHCGWMSVCVLACGLSAGSVHAQSTLDQDVRLWAPVYLTVQLPASFLGNMEVHPRFGEHVSELNQLVVRPVLGYQLTDYWSIWQGYTWVGTYRPHFAEEHHSIQQLIYRRAFSSFELVSRFMLEERVIGGADGTGVRARTLVRVDVPLPEAPKWAFVLYNEVLVNVNSVRNGPQEGFDENRFVAAMNRQVTDQISMDFGYQMQAQNKASSGLVNQMNHILLVQFFINL
ncbi:MAG: DUF2490 domain-containing protein [Nitrospira sp.]|nr:DUF2490 domain-containing protein [Nitrospira sp.]